MDTELRVEVEPESHHWRDLFTAVRKVWPEAVVEAQRGDCRSYGINEPQATDLDANGRLDEELIIYKDKETHRKFLLGIVDGTEGNLLHAIAGDYGWLFLADEEGDAATRLYPVIPTVIK